ncbi:MAG: rRNA cytosine-C5-methyltransferase [Flavobacteriia bacterium]|nr:rRNA cytosine-C5-methyltransferase [Flavobacteriia bacterium]
MIPFPIDFETRVKNDPFLGDDLLTALNTQVPTSIRFNPSKTKADLSILETIDWCENGNYLKTRPSFTLDPLFHAGTYYPQEAGSMVLDSVLKQLNLPEQAVILDLCAAPGGKSTLIASYLGNKGMLVSNEVINSRAKILRENITKWGYTNVVVTNNDPEHFSKTPDFFDVIVVDAPCSGEGMFRKDPNARTEWTNENVQLCAARQKRIVMDVWEALKPGGFLIYSTCTFNTAENEENVTWFLNQLEAELIPLNLKTPILKDRNNTGFYCIPGKTETEGFYITVIQKTTDDSKKQKFIKKNDLKIQKDTLDCANYTHLENITLFNWNEKLLAFPSNFIAEFLHLQANFHIVKMGTNVGEISRKGIIPNEELALNSFLRKYDSTIDLNQDQALQFLHGDTFSITGALGFQLISFQKEPLGWIKNIGNRFNNLYPKEWRIRMKI